MNFLLSSRAQRGICFFTNARREADSSGNVGPRNDKINVFPQPVMPVLLEALYVFFALSATSIPPDAKSVCGISTNTM
jgi:hypothetical protein